jgi:hypothetical protein
VWLLFRGLSNSHQALLSPITPSWLVRRGAHTGVDGKLANYSEYVQRKASQRKGGLVWVNSTRSFCCTLSVVVVGLPGASEAGNVVAGEWLVIGDAGKGGRGVCTGVLWSFGEAVAVHSGPGEAHAPTILISTSS